MRLHKCLAVLLVGLLVQDSTLTTAQPEEGLYFILRDTTYLPGSTVLITDIGTPGGTEHHTPGGTLVCMTTNVNTQCCRGSDGGNVGEWYFPDGSIVPRGSNPGDSAFTRTGSAQQVRLNRRFSTALEPLGEYQCRVPDGNGVLHTANITVALTLPDATGPASATEFASTESASTETVMVSTRLATTEPATTTEKATSAPATTTELASTSTDPEVTTFIKPPESTEPRNVTCASAGLPPGCANCSVDNNYCNAGGCYCDPTCFEQNDCCIDVPAEPDCDIFYVTTEPTSTIGTCESAGLSPGCANCSTGYCDAGGCYCDPTCFFFNDCCIDVPAVPVCFVENNTLLPTCTDAGLSPGCAYCTINDSCDAGGCFCDHLCHFYDDCCVDVPAIDDLDCVDAGGTPEPLKTCEGADLSPGCCTRDCNVDGCFCDSECHIHGDCCPDVIIMDCDKMPGSGVQPVTTKPNATTIALFQLRLLGILDCETWRADNPSSKDSDIMRSIVKNIAPRCECGFTEDHIVDRGFQCFPSSPQAVTYRAELYGTTEATAGELLQYIEQWVQEGVSISVQLHLLQLDSACNVDIISFADSECMPFETSTNGLKSSHQGVVVGAVVGVVISLVLLVAVVVIAVVVVKCRSRHTISQTEISIRASDHEEVQMSAYESDMSPSKSPALQFEDKLATLPRDENFVNEDVDDDCKLLIV